jgi:hypothetical protein
VDSPYGPVAIAWRVDRLGTFTAHVELPFGTAGTFIVPATDASRAARDGVATTGDRVALGPGSHDIEVTAARLVTPAGSRGS